MRFDCYAAYRHFRFYEKVTEFANPKLQQILSIADDDGRIFPSMEYMYKLHLDDQLLINDQFMQFNTRYNGADGIVYPTNQ